MITTGSITNETPQRCFIGPGRPQPAGDSSGPLHVSANAVGSIA